MQRLLPLCTLAVTLAGAPGAALADDMDGWCAQVKKASSIDICSDAEMRQQALARNKLFDAALARFGPEDHNALTNEHSRWIKSYTSRCGMSIDDPPPSMPIPQSVIECYRRESRARTAYLAEYLSVPNPMASTTAASPVPLPPGSVDDQRERYIRGQPKNIQDWLRSENGKRYFTDMDFQRRVSIAARDAQIVKGIAIDSPDYIPYIEEQAGLRQAAHQVPYDLSTQPPSAAGRADKISLVEANGVYRVPVLINGVLPLQFVLDSGAADVSLPADVFLTLRRTGTISDDDYIGRGNYRLADGSTVQSDKFFIRELKVGDRILKHIAASIDNVQSPLLLGQSFLMRFASVEIDNARHVLALGPERPDAALPTLPPGATPLPPGFIQTPMQRPAVPSFDPTKPYLVVPEVGNVAPVVPIDISKLKLTGVSLAYGPLLPEHFKFIVANAASQRVSELTIGYHEVPGRCTANLSDYDGFKKFSADYVGRPLDLTTGDSVVLETQFSAKARGFCIISAR